MVEALKNIENSKKAKPGEKPHIGPNRTKLYEIEEEKHSTRKDKSKKASARSGKQSDDEEDSSSDSEDSSSESEEQKRPNLAFNSHSKNRSAKGGQIN